ncbi:helix-turn-helix transcriptional regulator [Nocardioides bruguierae]|uniref:Helix-turn-helix transcriptional regulator n=1 Tax=Nocardioides bruguierae TaxID=2945102 RepID=A0A9X2D7C1_9ACTN|nr:helix-turn-helix transcriptional regulator [Nocardioides bruguierae]MCM0620389.1 helix-turn-helix transcriptional regulator [Nocardioides bruguierae]
MPLPPPESVLSALGVPRPAERCYQSVLSQSGRELVSIAATLLQTEQELLVDLQPLIDRGLVELRDSRVFVVTPAEAVLQAVEETSRAAAAAHRRLEAISGAIPHLTATNVRPHPGEVVDHGAVDGEISSGGNPVQLLTSLIRESSGDLLWFRAEHFEAPREDAMLHLIGEAMAKGRRSRAIYPVRAVTDMPDTLSRRAAAGEEIRLVPDLPTRMLIIGTTHVILPEPLGFMDEPRSLVRQTGWVQALTLWFESVWDQAMPYAQQSRHEVRADMRTFLLQQLASGAQDEQIARRLGVSLRTVRRRVADMMSELGAESRFQAGVEAARRGWL